MKGKFYDFDVYGQVNLNQYLAIQLGYRSITADYFVDEDQGTLKLTGPYFGGTARF